ncbi:MAG: type I-MYXAN CRISPR-associated protein Cas6/Cmx6 [Lautropia sp.]
MAETRSLAASTDLVFALHGETLPAGYRAGLWAALLDRLPWLADEPLAGVHPLRVPATLDAVVLLPRRARLGLRIPRERLADAARLSGCELEVAGSRLRVGDAHERPLLAHPTVQAVFVAADDDAGDEQAFHAWIDALLRAAAGPTPHICGRMKTLETGDGALYGASVVLHGLAPAQSLWWQRVGLGGRRSHGCGLMVPHKIIAGID